MRGEWNPMLERHRMNLLAAALALVASVSPATAKPVTPAHRSPAAHGAPATAAPTTAAKPTSPLAGHWEADMQGDGKLFTFVFDFTCRGDSLGGTVGIANRDMQTPVRGTVKGNTLHFEQFGLWNGTLDGANLKLTRGLDGGKVQHMSAHRAAPARP